MSSPSPLFSRSVRSWVGLLFLALLCTAAEAQEPPSPSSDTTRKGAPYVPTPRHVVLKMLRLADVSADDTVYDLGSGDGRIVIMAAKEFGARGVGIEIDSQLVQTARRRARRAGVSDLVEFRREDLFTTSLDEASVVTLYLWPTMNDKLRPKLRRELDPGDRVVSHSFDIDGWPPDTTVYMKADAVGGSATGGKKTLFRWTIPDSSNAP